MAQQFAAKLVVVSKTTRMVPSFQGGDIGPALVKVQPPTDGWFVDGKITAGELRVACCVMMEGGLVNAGRMGG